MFHAMGHSKNRIREGDFVLVCFVMSCNPARKVVRKLKVTRIVYRSPRDFFVANFVKGEWSRVRDGIDAANANRRPWGCEKKWWRWINPWLYMRRLDAAYSSSIDVMCALTPDRRAEGGRE
jgi:hypothetical protein